MRILNSYGFSEIKHTVYVLLLRYNQFLIPILSYACVMTAEYLRV